MNTDDAEDRVQLRRRQDEGSDDTETELLVDDARVRYGQLPDGMFFLYENAYVWSDNLQELGHQLLADRALGRVPHSGDRLAGGE